MPEGDVTGTAPHLVPDTLDLAGGRLAINALLGSLDPEADCEPGLLGFFHGQPAVPAPVELDVQRGFANVPRSPPVSPAANQDGGNIEFGILKAVAKTIEHDGSIYDEERPERPCNSGIGCGKGLLTRGLRGWPGMGDLSSGFASSQPGRRRVHGLSGRALDRGSDDGFGDSRGPLSLLSQRRPRKRLQLHPRGAAGHVPGKPSDERKARRGPS